MLGNNRPDQRKFAEIPVVMLQRSVPPGTNNNLTRVRLRSPGRASEGGDGRAGAVGNGPANAGSLGDRSYGGFGSRARRPDPGTSLAAAPLGASSVGHPGGSAR